MSTPRTVLVVGGGAAGNAVTILLRRAGLTVDLVEAKDDWNATAGSGITLQGNALRVLRELGVWEQVEASGFGFGSVGITTPDGTVLHVQDDLRTGGLGSATRAAIGITDKPEPTGMAIWRIAAPRPAGLTRTDLAYGGPAHIAGYCPTGETTLYAYVVEANRDRAGIPPASYADEMRGLTRHYGGFWPDITEHITDPAKVNYTWFDRLLVEGSWHRGRVVLVGDAAHCCPPTLAQGAALSLEDAWVLAQMLTGSDVWDDALFQAYYERRIARVRPVVAASVQIGQWQLDGVRDADLPGLMGRTMTMLRELP